MSVREVGSDDTPSTGEHAMVTPISARFLASRSTDQLAAAYEAIPAPVVIAWREGPLTLNAAARQLLGRSSTSSVQAHHSDLTPKTPGREPMTLAELPIARALRGETVAGVRLVVRAGLSLDDDDTAGDRTWTAEANPIRSGGEICGAICIYRDVTERALDEEMGDELLGTAAHDLRTPLTALKACVQLIERGLDRLDENARARTLSLLVAQVDKLSAKVDDVLDAARIRRGRVDVAPVDLDVTRELGQIIDEARRAPGALACEANIEAGLLAHTDPARLRQVVRGILLEACDRSVKGAPVVVRASESPQGVEIVIETKPARESSRARTMRTLARRLVERLGGRAFDTLDERGSIRFTLPRAHGAPT